MSAIIETTVYTLAELADTAKEKARAWYRRGNLDDDWWDTVTDDFTTICGILGVSLRTRAVKLMGGGTRDKPSIYFRGFSSQGDGACFEGRYAYAKASVPRIKAYAPKDETLQAIARRLEKTQKRNFFAIKAKIEHRGHYYHEQSMLIDVHRDGAGMTADAEDDVAEALRDLARWLYRSLETEFDYLNSDEVVDEAIIVNDYTFTADGGRFG